MVWNCDYPPNPPYYDYYTTAGFPTAMCMGTEVDTVSPHPSPPAGTDSERRKYTYNLKIINPKKKSQFVVENLEEPERLNHHGS